MNNKNINITPLTKDEQNQLHGGFGIIRVSTGLYEGNANTNCDATLTKGDKNTNCSKCLCGGPVHIHLQCAEPDPTPVKP